MLTTAPPTEAPTEAPTQAPTQAPVTSLRARTWARHRDGGLPCRDGDGELWFADDPADLELAKSLCGDCPVRNACLAGALERAEPWGVWGGELFALGVVASRKRPRGWPRKDAEAA
jgi:WhiB family transcriptional regulator, redox-sensing transcriptional regulator